MKVIRSSLFNSFSKIKFGFSTKPDFENNTTFGFNLSLSVGDDPSRVHENRKLFVNKLGLKPEQIAYQKQIHSDLIKYIDCGGTHGESDALVTDRPNVGLAISSADCTAIFIYDSNKHIIAGIHSGWRGTQKQIVTKTLNFLRDKFSCTSNDLFVYIAPAICQKNYEVGREVAEQFDKKYLKQKGDKYLLDVSAVNYHMLLEFGIPNTQIELSELCTFENDNLLHSYRRDGIKSGRALGIISMTGN